MTVRFCHPVLWICDGCGKQANGWDYKPAPDGWTVVEGERLEHRCRECSAQVTEPAADHKP